MTAALLGCPEGSVSRVMTPETVVLHQDLTVGQALRVVREKGADWPGWWACASCSSARPSGP